MSFPTDGVYTIRNVGRSLMLDLKDNYPAEGHTIQGYPSNETTAQQWIVRNQDEPHSPNNSFSIQSNNGGDRGNGFFTAKQDSGEAVFYTREAWIVDLTHGANDVFTISFTQGSDNLVLSIPSGTDSTVKLENFLQGNPRQQWEFKRLNTI